MEPGEMASDKAAAIAIPDDFGTCMNAKGRVSSNGAGGAGIAFTSRNSERRRLKKGAANNLIKLNLRPFPHCIKLL